MKRSHASSWPVQERCALAPALRSHCAKSLSQTGPNCLVSKSKDTGPASHEEGCHGICSYALQRCFISLPHNNLSEEVYYPHFTDGNTEVKEVKQFNVPYSMT